MVTEFAAMANRQLGAAIFTQAASQSARLALFAQFPVYREKGIGPNVGSVPKIKKSSRCVTLTTGCRQFHNVYPHRERGSKDTAYGKTNLLFRWRTKR
jgi:hypothetical protein